MSRLVLFCFFIVVSQISFSQSEKDKLTRKKASLIKEINELQQLLDKNKKDQQKSMVDIIRHNEEIKARKNLITTTNYEINFLTEEINKTRDQIKSLHDELANLKDEYAKIIYFSYKSRNSYDRLMFIFASDDFLQAYRRLKYLNQYTLKRKEQVALIKDTQQALDEKVEELEAQVMKKKLLLTEQEIERKELEKTKQKKNKDFKYLQSKAGEIKKKIKKRKLARQKLQRAIEEAIRKEIEARSQKDVYVPTPAEKQLSNTFAANKKKLPWPTDKGYVCSSYGVHPHPVLKSVKIKNDGIDICTAPGTKARAIYNGKVTGVASVPNMGRVVIIRHGVYLSVYSNLDDVYVKMGDEVKTKQEVGKVLTNAEDNSTILQFQIHYGSQLQNPVYWLVPRN